MVAEQDRQRTSSLDENLGFLRRQVRRLPPSWLQRIGRLKSRVASLQAKRKTSPEKLGAPDRLLMEHSDETLNRSLPTSAGASASRDRNAIAGQSGCPGAGCQVCG